MIKRTVTGEKLDLTPRMTDALRRLSAGDPLAFADTSIGRPTKQRLSKLGLAEYQSPREGENKWDAPMRLTSKGRAAAESLPREGE